MSSFSDGHRKTVLLVLHGAEFTRQVREFVQDSGYAVLEAASEREAMSLSADYRNSIDLLLTELAKTNPEGASMARNFVLQRPETRALLISGDPEPVVREVVSGERLAFIEKPFSWLTLANKLQELFDFGEESRAVSCPGA